MAHAPCRASTLAARAVGLLTGPEAEQVMADEAGAAPVGAAPEIPVSMPSPTTASAPLPASSPAPRRRARRAAPGEVVAPAADADEPLLDAANASTSLLLRLGARHAADYLSEALAPLKLHTRHYGILLTLAEQGPSSQSSLGRRLDIDRTTMVAAVDELERQGYVARKPHPDDRRANRVELTGRGRGRLVRATGAVAAAETRLLASFSAEEIQTLRGLLTRLVGQTVR